MPRFAWSLDYCIQFGKAFEADGRSREDMLAVLAGCGRARGLTARWCLRAFDRARAVD